MALTERDKTTARPPIATLAVLGITAITTGLQWLYPALLPALDRNAAGLLAGQWWRLITPRFVQPDIWPQYILLAMLAVVGIPLERRLGSLRWLAVWLTAGVVGEGISYLWQPQGAGASLGLFGLMGAWLVLVLRRESAGPWWVAAVVLALLVDLIGVAVSSALVGAMAAAVVAALVVPLAQRVAWSHLAPALGVAGLLGGLILTVLRDQHGPPLLTGAYVAAILVAVVQPREADRRYE